MTTITRRWLHLLLGPVFFLLIHFSDFEGLSTAGKGVMACTAWIAYWWITEAVELAVTSLLPVIIFPLSGALSLSETTTSFGNPFIFLFLGGFIIGLAIEKWNLHTRIAFAIIRKTGTSEKKVLLGFMLATAFLSMWISNTATAVMMLPIGVSVASQFKNRDRFARNLMLGIAYSASIGGMATLIGTPPNLILAAVVRQSLGIEISFLHWMLFATPFSLVLLAICWLYLSRKLDNSHRNKQVFSMQSPGKMTTAEKRVLAVFAAVAFLWISRTFLLNRFIPQADDTIIAISGAIILFIIPSGNRNEKLMDWQTARNLPWDILLIFGAGLAIAKGFSDTDLTSWLTSHFSEINVWPFLILLIIIASINFLTEITSNTATASVVLPLLYSLSVSLNAEALPILTAATLAASCAFMLPVATPPNAIVFSSGKIKMKDMIRVGFFLNIVSILLIFCFVQFFIKILF